MSESYWKKRFCEQLKLYIKTAKVKQFELADMLNISASAVSQMLSGQLVPSLKQLEVIMDRLALDRNACSELRDYLARIRSGDEDLRSPLNDFIRNSRIKAGLSLEQLAQMSGIDKGHLFNMENLLAVNPTAFEAARLAAILNCEVSELCQTIPENKSYSGLCYSKPNFAPSGTMCDGGKTYGVTYGQNHKAPVIDFAALKFFNSDECSFNDFAWHHMKRTENCNKQGMVYVNARGRDLEISDLYTVNMCVAAIDMWMPGAMIIGCADKKLYWGRAEYEENAISVIGIRKKIYCQWYLLVNSYTFNSGIYEGIYREDKAGESGQDNENSTPGDFRG